jgi:UDPglucose 6-dehydrogenase
MRLTVIGIGYLGLTHAVCMADLGHEVIGLDADTKKLAQAANGEMPFFEPGLEPLLRKNLDAGRLRFTTSYEEAAGFGDVHFVCVGTPQAEDGSADMRQVYGAVDALSVHLSRSCLVVGKSTVPVGTARSLLARIRGAAPAGDEVELAWNPEFLREGFAVQDSLSPDRFVFGVTSQRAAELLCQVYATPLASGIPWLDMDLETAELVKVSANAFLATKISFINAMAEVCEKVGADVVRLADALGHDERIGKRFLAPGLGFGGGCLPKDIRAFQSAVRELGVASVANILAEVDAINVSRRERAVELAREAAGGTLRGRRLTVLGLAFKPGSDDVRDSPSLYVCGLLVKEGAVVTAHDPVAAENAARIRPDLRYAGSVSEAAADADVVLHLTEWAEYRAIDPVMLATVVARCNIIDARCTLDEGSWRSAGWSFRTLGRMLYVVTTTRRHCRGVSSRIGNSDTVSKHCGHSLTIQGPSVGLFDQQSAAPPTGWLSSSASPAAVL